MNGTAANGTAGSPRGNTSQSQPRGNSATVAAAAVVPNGAAVPAVHFAGMDAAQATPASNAAAKDKAVARVATAKALRAIQAPSVRFSLRHMDIHPVRCRLDGIQFTICLIWLYALAGARGRWLRKGAGQLCPSQSAYPQGW
jgi:hypothetical protein